MKESETDGGDAYAATATTTCPSCGGPMPAVQLYCRECSSRERQKRMRVLRQRGLALFLILGFCSGLGYLAWYFLNF